MRALTLIAGKTARARIEEAGGLTPSLVSAMVGASGGPKWLVLAGLDRLIFTDWLKNASQPIDMVGSSIGAWRMTMATHPDTTTMFERFLAGYLSYNYRVGEPASETTANSYALLRQVFTPEDARAVVTNPARRLNIVTVRVKGLAAEQSQALQGLGFMASAAGNLISRKTLVSRFDRAIFHTG